LAHKHFMPYSQTHTLTSKSLFSRLDFYQLQRFMSDLE